VNILDVNIGEKVLGYNPDTEKNEFVTVKDRHVNGKKKVYRIKTESGKTLECTMDHKLLIEHGMKPLSEVIENGYAVKV